MEAEAIDIGLEAVDEATASNSLLKVLKSFVFKLLKLQN